MGKRTRIKLIIRTILLLSTLAMYVIDYKLIDKFMNIELFFNIRIYNVLWVYLMYEMIIVLFPNSNNYTYSGKHFLRHYKEDCNYNKHKLKEFTRKNNVRAVRAIVFWVGLNFILWCIYVKLNLNTVYIYMLFLFYYWSDMFCINVWCPFHKIIVKNKCCNECRIYNWGHLMYLTPLIFIKSLWTYSLALTGVVVFAQWEYLNLKYPERFSPISNKNLRCSECNNTCRYNKLKFENRRFHAR